MTDRNTQKEIDTVINKYIDRHWGKKAFGVGSGIIIGLTLGLDFLITGGISTTAVLLSSGGAGLAGLFGGVIAYAEETYENAAGQRVSYDYTDVSMALNKMESKLQAAFKKAAAPDATKEIKNDFKNLADEIGQDVRKLFPVFKIVSGKPKDKYEFIVAERFPAPGKKNLVSLTQALQELNLAPVPERKSEPKKPTPEEEIQQLKARLESLENPKIVRLDKKPNNPPSP